MKLNPMVMLKRKRPKEDFPSGVFVHFHEKGWTDEQGVRLCIDNIWKKRPGHPNSRSLVGWNSFRSRVTEGVKSHLKECKTETVVIPAELTSLLQPLDVCINKPFKNYVREEWKVWMANDDIFVIIESGKEEAFLNYLNSLFPDIISFTIEKEMSGGQLKTTVYRKPTHSNTYLHFSSHHRRAVMKGIIRGMVKRALGRFLTEFLTEELHHIHKTFKENGYSSHFLRSVMQETIENSRRVHKNDLPCPRILLPYYKGLSEKIQRLGRRLQFSVCYKRGANLRSLLRADKVKPPADKFPGVVYEKHGKVSNADRKEKKKKEERREKRIEAPLPTLLTKNRDATMDASDEKSRRRNTTRSEERNEDAKERDHRLLKTSLTHPPSYLTNLTQIFSILLTPRTQGLCL
ncbi:hypothetical protein M514_26460 [Trichuris suis]|uniref:Uncharacterized protein n=1 Tax=Trichuris suis TaxID=68888 RepID=A0A085MVT1_9BILA|nr:hypothetical protein M514_26460 [Trichuris suis]